MRGILHTLTLLATVIAVMALPAAALADNKAEARKHFARAVELVDDGQLSQALVEFQRSYDLTSHFAVLYNIGQVLVSLGKPVEAADAFERYLAEGGTKIERGRRAEVEKEIARQKSRIAEVEIRGLPDGAVVRVDGNEIGQAPLGAPVRVGVGTHVVAASADGFEAAEASLTVAGEDHRVVELVLAKPEVVPPPPPLPDSSNSLAQVPPATQNMAGEGPTTVTQNTEAPAPPLHRWTRLRVAGIATAAVGVVGLVTGGICWATAKSRHDQALDYWDKNDMPKADARQSEAQDYALAANISFIAGGALIATGVVLYIVGNEKTHFTPAVGHDFAGLTAGGTW